MDASDCSFENGFCKKVPEINSIENLDFWELYSLIVTIK
jgi:hypothetical protein